MTVILKNDPAWLAKMAARYEEFREAHRERKRRQREAQRRIESGAKGEAKRFGETKGTKA